MGNRRLVPTISEREKAGEILTKILFNGNGDEETGLWLHEHLQKRLPGVEKILASDREAGSGELLDCNLPQTLVDMFGSEIFEGKHGSVLRGKILDKILENGEYRKILNIHPGMRLHDTHARTDTKTGFAGNLKMEADKRVKCMKKDRKKYPWRPGGVLPEGSYNRSGCPISLLEYGVIQGLRVLRRRSQRRI